MSKLTASRLYFGKLRKLATIVSAGAFVLTVFSLQTFAQDDVTSGSSVITSRPTSAPRKPVRKPLRSTTEAQGKTTSKKTKTVNISAPESDESNVNDSAKGGENYFLNEEAALLPLPVWSREAKAANADGLVEVTVTIDEKGDVTTAKARTGNELLYEAAEKAALQAKFNSAKTAKRTGFLLFCFGNHPDCN